MNNFKIYNKDSRNLSKFLTNKSIHFIVFSPPYWNLRNYNYDEQIGHKQTYKKYLEDMKKVFSECFKVLKDGRYMAINIGTVVSNEGMKFVCGDFIKLAEECGFIFRKDIIWHKPKGTTKWQRGATQFTQNPYPLFYNTNINHEFILIFSKGNNESNKIKKNEKKFNKIFTRQMAYSVWDIIPINSPNLDEKHVAPFPEEIPKRLILLYSSKGEWVLDPFAGCGTANKVAHELGRKTVAVEMSKEYIKLIKNKIKNAKFNSFNFDKIYNDNIELKLDTLEKDIENARYQLKKNINKKEKFLKDNKKKIQVESKQKKFDFN